MSNTDFRLHCECLAGNMFSVVETINKLCWADYVICMESSGCNTIVVFKLPWKVYQEEQRRKAERDKKFEQAQQESIPT